jgi:hypothetical protein
VTDIFLSFSMLDVGGFGERNGRICWRGNPLATSCLWTNAPSAAQRMSRTDSALSQDASLLHDAPVRQKEIVSKLKVASYTCTPIPHQ